MVRAHVLHDAHVEPENSPVACGREPGVMRLLPGVTRALHELRARLDPLQGPAQPMGEHGDEDVLGVDPFLGTESPAGVGDDDPHALGGEAEPSGHCAPHGVGRLVGRPDRHASRGGVELCARAPRLQGHRGHTPVPGVILDDHLRAGEGALDVPERRADMADDVARAGMDSGGIRTHGPFCVEHGRQRLVLHAHSLGGVGRLIDVGRDDHRDGLTDIADLPTGERGLRAWRVQPHVGILGVGMPGGERIVEPGKVVGGEDADSAQGASGGEIDAHDARPSMGGAHEDRVE